MPDYLFSPLQGRQFGRGVRRACLLLQSCC
jgi:hypothetical protein